MTTIAGVVWFLGGGGVIVGVLTGAMAKTGMGRVGVLGLVLGMVAGVVLSGVFVHDVEASTSSTAAIGLILVPIPPISNAITGFSMAVIVSGWRQRSQS
jgi:hypothetical protein